MLSAAFNAASLFLSGFLGFVFLEHFLHAGNKGPTQFSMVIDAADTVPVAGTIHRAGAVIDHIFVTHVSSPFVRHGAHSPGGQGHCFLLCFS